MSRVLLPEFTCKTDAHDYLRKNKDKLSYLKSSESVKSEECDLGCAQLDLPEKSFSNKSNAIPETIKVVKDDALKEGEIRVKAYGNVCGWCDSHMDVLITDSAKKTIKDKGASNKQLIYHLKNHGRNTDDIVGKSVKMSLAIVDLSLFNIKSDIKEAQVIMGESIVPFEYDEKCYKLYRDGEIKQHSIGLFYVKLFLCLDSNVDEDKEEKKNWDKYYPQVINKQKVDDKGYFWAVTQIRLLEYSAVLWGSNELSITEDVEKTEEEPLKNTPPKEEEPPKSTQEEEGKKRRKKLLLL